MSDCSSLIQHPDENVKSHLTQQLVTSNGWFVATFMLDVTTSIIFVATRANFDLFEYSPTVLFRSLNFKMIILGVYYRAVGNRNMISNSSRVWLVVRYGWAFSINRP